MEILSHRGLWRAPEERNTFGAFQESFKLGFGLETDFRDLEGKLVISHDIPSANSRLADDFFSLHAKYNGSLPLAINIKSDGLQTLLGDLLAKYNITNYFVFDMSVPDAIIYFRKEFKVFTRLSEFEKDTYFYDQTDGIWLDAFERRWYDASTIFNHSRNGKKVCIVSEELHKRDYKQQWQWLRSEKLHQQPHIYLCTDFPVEAKIFFQ